MKRDYMQDERVIGAFVSQAKPKEIQSVAGIGRSTYYKLISNREFMAIVHERRDAIVKEAVMKMQGYLSEDADMLQKIIRDDITPPATKVSAIKAMFDMFLNLKAQTDILERLEALEANSGTF